MLKHDQGYIGTTGAEMLGLSLVQIVFAIGAVYLGARVAMGFGRDVRGSLFHTVTAFSAREVGSFGAPSLITRITNDVQQVQMLVVMAATMALAAPITIVGRRDPGPAPGRRAVASSWSSACPVLAIVLGRRSSP